SICRSSVTICSGLYFLVGIPALLQSEFSLTSAGTKNPGQVTPPGRPRRSRRKQECLSPSFAHFHNLAA
ncbi:MAG: hypothetical protein WBE13_03035, partial [Candidatus Acidiferrum sp.]